MDLTVSRLPVSVLATVSYMGEMPLILPGGKPVMRDGHPVTIPVPRVTSLAIRQSYPMPGYGAGSHTERSEASGIIAEVSYRIEVNPRTYFPDCTVELKGFRLDDPSRSGSFKVHLDLRVGDKHLRYPASGEQEVRVGASIGLSSLRVTFRVPDTVRALLGGEALNVDDYDDLAAYINSWTAREYEGLPGTVFHLGGARVTSLSHFQTSHHPGTHLWVNQSGYHYPWATGTAELNGAVSSFDLNWADVEVDNEYSLALDRYRTHFRGNVREWERNWEFDGDWFGPDWDIRDTQFSPLSALAYYWYRRYMDFPQEGARTGLENRTKISGIRLLGGPLHAAGDVTVPQHALGVMGYGHQAYEDEFPVLCKSGIKIGPSGTAFGRDDALIAAHLREREFLRRGNAPVLARLAQTLQVTTVTGDARDSGTDAYLELDVGGRRWELGTDMDDFESGHDDVFTLNVVYEKKTLRGASSPRGGILPNQLTVSSSEAWISADSTMGPRPRTRSDRLRV